MQNEDIKTTTLMFQAVEETLTEEISEIKEEVNVLNEKTSSIESKVSNIESLVRGSGENVNNKISKLIDSTNSLKDAVRSKDKDFASFKTDLETLKTTPKSVEKEYGVMDIKGLPEVLNAIQAQPTSQPMTLDVYDGTNLIKGGVTRVNSPGATYSNGTVTIGGGTVSPLTTKGDLYTYDTAGTRLGVGADGQILIADSTQATGLRWGKIGLNYLGTWNATTNTPTIVSGTGVGGDYYIVSVAGTTSIDGITDWEIGDWIIFNDETSTWQKIDNSEALTTITDWTAATPYKANDVVKFGTRTLRRIAAGTSNGAFTNAEAALWTLLSNPVATAWASTNYEYQGELFTVGTRTVVRTAADGVSGLTFDAAESANYEVVEKLTLASFQATTLYYKDEKFTDNGMVYRRFNTGMSGATFDATEQVEWRVDGNDNNPIGSTTSTRTAASVTVGYDDGELILQPAGATMNVTLNSTLPDGKEFGMNGIVDSTKVITWTAGAGTTIQDPVTNLPVASFNNSTWINTAPFSFQLIKVSNVWRIRGM